MELSTSSARLPHLDLSKVVFEDRDLREKMQIVDLYMGPRLDGDDPQHWMLEHMVRFSQYMGEPDKSYLFIDEKMVGYLDQNGYQETCWGKKYREKGASLVATPPPKQA